MTSLKDLADQFDELAKSLPISISNNLSAKVAELILFHFINETPVDSGKAISNWLVTLNQPSQQKVAAHYPGKAGSTAQLNREYTYQLGEAVIKSKQPGDTVFITNNLPYIDALNTGWSDQNPGGFVEGGVLLARLYAENPSDFAR